MKKSIIFVLAVLVLTTIVMAFTGEKPKDVKGYAIGDIAEDFSLKNVDGRMVSLDSYSEAKGWVVVFTCNTCPWAKKYEQRLIDMHNISNKKGYPVVAIQPNDPAISGGDSFEAMQRRSKEKGFPFVYLFDEDQSVFPKYGATKTPHVFLLDSDKKVRYIGAIDDSPADASGVETNYVLSAIESIDNGESVKVTSTKAIGCSIKRSRS